jgi:iron complex outermembrane receptor protein
MTIQFTLRTIVSGASLLACATALPTPGFAQDAPPPAATDAAADSPAHGEILVTARRRAERAQDVPIALTAVDGATLQRTGYGTLNQIADLTPSLNIRSLNPRNTFANIRGLGSNSTQNDGLEVGVGIYIDDVYYGRIGSSQFDLIDLERVEVLRGPQGTLFGKNTTAGAINIATREPSFTPEFRGEASVGENSYWQLRASGNIPLLDDRIALRLTTAHTEADGTLVNDYNGAKLGWHRDNSARAQLLLQPTETLKVKLIADYAEQNSNRATSFLGIVTRYDNGAAISNNFADRLARLRYTPSFGISDPFARHISVNAPVDARMTSAGVSAKADLNLGAATLTSITAYRAWNWMPHNDSDFLPLDINRQGGTSNRQSQFSQEVRFASTSERTIDYVMGAYYFWQVVRAVSRFELGSDYAAWNNPTANQTIANYAFTGFQSNSAADPRTKSVALFGQATWHATDALSVTGGLRFTHEKKQASYRQYTAAGNNLALLSDADRKAVQALRDGLYPETSAFNAESDNALTGQVNIAYKIAPDILAYATYSRGVKSGGVNVGQVPAGVSAIVKPEKIDAFEAGLKTQFWDRRITANLAAFTTDVAEYQTAIVEPIGTTTLARRYISNIPGVRSRGFEADVSVAPSHYVRLGASAAYSDTYYKYYPNAQSPAEIRNQGQIQNLSGRQLPNVPKFIYTLSVDLAYPVQLLEDSVLYLRADFNHRSAFSTDDTGSRYSSLPGYGVANARMGVRVEEGRWDLSVWARNLFDKQYFNALSTAATGLISGTIGDPQQFGATLRAQF